MAFQGRDRGKRAREEPDSGSRSRRGLRATRSAPRWFPVETLETRVLLSTNASLLKFFRLSDRDFLPSPVMIVPLVARDSPFVARPGTAIDGPVGLTAGPQSETAPLAKDMAAMGIDGTIDLNPPSANIAISGANESTSGGQGPSDSTMTLASYSTLALGEESVPPLVVMAGPVMEATTGDGSVSNPLTWNFGPTTSPLATNQGDADSGQASGASAAGELNSAEMPDARHVEFDSTLDSTHSSMAILIPVDPATEAIGLSLRDGPWRAGRCSSPR